MYPDPTNPAVLRAAGQREQVAESELLDRSIATVVHAPLLAADEVVGVISILSVEGEKLSARNSDLLRAVSYQVGTAIENARLVESIRVHQRELEEKNTQLELFVEELMKADRLKNEFLANTSHELRTPLNSIIGFINLVLEGLCENEEEQRELLTHAVRSGRHLLDLINDVLDLSRIEAGRLQLDMRDLELGPIVADVESTLAVQAYERELSFDVHPMPAGTVVHADEARLRQVLMNVVGNAIKFTPRGGVVVTTEWPAGSSHVVIRVEDTGIGIPNEVRDRLFRKFTQGDTSTTRKYGGSGLGLVIVKELVEMMGGSVRLESDGEGRGTVVSILIPKATGSSPPPSRDPLPRP
jgi:signal transduction histidine kinase